MQIFFLLYFSLFFSVLGLPCCWGFSLVVASRGYSLVVLCRLLMAVASLVGEHRLQGAQASVVELSGLQSIDSIVVVHRLRCSVACGILPDEGSNLCILHWQADSSPRSHQGRPQWFLMFITCACSCVKLHCERTMVTLNPRTGGYINLT